MRRTRLLVLLTQLLSMIAFLCASGSVAQAQTDRQDALQIIPPEVPRYRQVPPAFVVKADQKQKPLPPPVFRPQPSEDPQVSAPPVPAPPSPEDLKKKRARIAEAQRQTAMQDTWHERLVAVGKVLGFILVVGVGAVAVADIVRQFRLAKHLATLPREEDEDESEL